MPGLHPAVITAKGTELHYLLARLRKGGLKPNGYIIAEVRIPAMVCRVP